MKIDIITCSECRYFQSWGRKGEALARFGQAYSCSIEMLPDPKPNDYCVRAEKKIEKYIPKTPCDLCAYNPPSSTDGKPCSMCPAVGKEVQNDD